MNKLQAAMKDKSAKRWRESKVMYRVGSCIKGCRQCGITEWVTLSNGREVERWKTGLDVFRSYDPASCGWTWWCWSCGAKDAACWDQSDNAVAQLGKPPASGTGFVVWKDRGAEDGVKAARLKLIRNAVKMRTKLDPFTVARQALSVRQEAIQRLEEQIELLRQQIVEKGGR
jgi:hypothetical protein